MSDLYLLDRSKVRSNMPRLAIIYAMSWLRELEEAGVLVKVVPDYEAASQVAMEMREADYFDSRDIVDAALKGDNDEN